MFKSQDNQHDPLTAFSICDLPRTSFRDNLFLRKRKIRLKSVILL